MPGQSKSLRQRIRAPSAARSSRSQAADSRPSVQTSGTFSRNGRPAPAASSSHRPTAWSSRTRRPVTSTWLARSSGSTPASRQIRCSSSRPAGGAGLPFRLTLHQLMAAPATPSAEEIFVCESPLVLRAAAELNVPLVCTEGRLSAASDRLLRAAEGARIRWRSEFGWPGIRMTAAAAERYAATPWRMSADDYDAALVSRTDRLEGSRSATPWDPRLADAMAHEGHAAREEWLLPDLLADLR